MPTPTAEPRAPTEQRWWRLFTREHWFIFACASLAWLFDCLDSQLFNLARDGAMDELLANPAKATEYAPYTTSIFLLGWAAGGLVFGALGDRFGRARMLVATVFVYSLSSGLSGFSASYFDFCLYRFIAGFGVGGVFGLAVALVADAVPDRTRAPALGLLQSLSTWGNITAGLIGMSIGVIAAHHALPFGVRPWRITFLVGAVPAALCVLVMRRMGEPPAWVAARRAGQARGVRFGSYAALLGDRRWAGRAWLGLLICSAGIIGLWGIGNFHPKIVGSIVDAHLAKTHATPEFVRSEKVYWSAVGLLLQNIGGFVGMMTLAKIAQVKGRKTAYIIAMICSFLSTVLVFRFLREVNQIYWMLPLMGFGQLSVFAVYAIYLPELFPLSLRSTGTSFCYNFGRVIAATAPFTIGQITRHLGGDVESFRTAGAWVSLVLLLGLVAIPFLPETKDRPLPED